jgi:serine phosphatase RsbU (regulator of sigma subunit)/pSer/pThr/pTyr-binding forkhead associated (FHA) protein
MLRTNLNQQRDSSKGTPIGFLEVRGKTGEVSVVPVTTTRLIIGREKDAGLRLDHDTVSRRHAELLYDPFERWWVRDLVSRNGTRVRGRRVTEEVLRSGDPIQIGEFTLTLRIPGPSPAPPASSSTATIVDAPDVELSTLTQMEAPTVAASHLSTLIDLGQALNETEDERERMRLLCSLLVSGDFHGFSAMVLRLRKDEPEHPAQILCGPEPEGGRGEGQCYVSRSLLRKVLQTGEPVLAGNSPSGHIDTQLSIAADLMTISAVACPIRSDEESLDILYAILPPEFGLPSWLAMASLAARQYQLSETIWSARANLKAHAVIEHDLRQARTIQQRLVPRRISVPEMDIAISFEPCRWVAGDYVDVVPMPDGRVFLAVADACGKGLQAALVASCLHTLIHAGLRARMPLQEMMTGVNEHLYEYLGESSFVTMVAVILDISTGELECFNAGHPHPILVGVNGQSQEVLIPSSVPLGVGPADFVCDRMQLDRHQLLAMFTDGWTDLMNSSEERLSLSRFCECLGAIYVGNRNRPLQAAADQIIKELDAHRGNCLPNDDRTLLMARRR